MILAMPPAGLNTSYRLLPASWQYLACIITAAVLILLTMPAGAIAETGYEVHPGATEIILPVEKKGNHVVSVSANEQQHVQFAVEGLLSTTEYSTKGHVNSRRIQANFDTLG